MFQTSSSAIVSVTLQFLQYNPYIYIYQELIKRSLYLPYLASESTLSRVDFFIEHLPWEIQHAHCCKSQSPLGHSARPLL